MANITYGTFKVNINAAQKNLINTVILCEYYASYVLFFNKVDYV